MRGDDEDHEAEFAARLRSRQRKSGKTGAIVWGGIFVVIVFLLIVAHYVG